MKRIWATSAGAALILAAASLFAQVSPETPPPGEPEVFGLFLQYQDSLVQGIQKQESEDPSVAQNMERGAAAMLKLSVAEFQKINPVYRVMKSQFEALIAEALAYTREMAAKKAPMDIKKVGEFEARRKRILTDGTARLKSTLSPDGWAALSAYVDGQYRLTVKRAPLAPSR